MLSRLTTHFPDSDTARTSHRNVLLLFIPHKTGTKRSSWPRLFVICVVNLTFIIQMSDLQQNNSDLSFRCPCLTRVITITLTWYPDIILRNSAKLHVLVTPSPTNVVQLHDIWEISIPTSILPTNPCSTSWEEPFSVSSTKTGICY